MLLSLGWMWKYRNKISTTQWIIRREGITNILKLLISVSSTEDGRLCLLLPSSTPQVISFPTKTSLTTFTVFSFWFFKHEQIFFRLLDRYNSLQDESLAHYFANETIQKHLLKAGLVSVTSFVINLNQLVSDKTSMVWLNVATLGFR